MYKGCLKFCTTLDLALSLKAPFAGAVNAFRVTWTRRGRSGINYAWLHETRKNKKANIKCNNYQGLPVESHQGRPESLETFQPSLIRIRPKMKWSVKAYFEKDDFRWLLQAAHFSTKNPINKPAMNNRRILMAAVIHFVHPVEKDS